MSLLSYQGKYLTFEGVYLNQGSPLIVDYDGNVYSTVTIGTQTWLSKNLMTTHYTDGTPIVNLSDPSAWIADSSGAYCWYSNNISFKNPYGAMYNWYATQNVIGFISGWHVPDMGEWMTLRGFVETLPEDAGRAGYYLKEIGEVHWAAGNDAVDLYGFTAVGAGLRNGVNGAFNNMGSLGEYAAESYDATYTDVAGFSEPGVLLDIGYANNINHLKKTGNSIRLLKN